MFGCTELDVAKFLASLRVNYPRMDRWDMAFKTLATYNNIELDLLSVLTAAELIRIHKYHPEKEFIMEQVKYVFETKMIYRLVAKVGFTCSTFDSISCWPYRYATRS